MELNLPHFKLASFDLANSEVSFSYEREEPPLRDL